jgi:hypothetical protein
MLIIPVTPESGRGDKITLLTPAPLHGRRRAGGEEINILDGISGIFTVPRLPAAGKRFAQVYEFPQ